jgi:hypothetical protein
MGLVTEMELPELDYVGAELKGERFHEVMEELAERSWLATSPIGFFVLDREAAAFFLRTRSATFPGMKIAEMFQVREGPLLEEMRRNMVDGEPHDFDIAVDRGDAKPLTFGAGIHYCLGANLARAELQEALAFLPQRMPGLALDGEPELGSVHGIYGLERLPVRWNTA